MLRVRPHALESVADAQRLVQLAIEVELSTLPPYLYALTTVAPGSNQPAVTRLASIIREEMIHMALACNLMNALGGTPLVADAKAITTYPGPLPGGIGDEHGQAFIVHLLPFSPAAIEQGMQIEEPEGGPIVFPERAAQRAALAEATPTFTTIGQLYHLLDAYLAGLPPDAWHRDRPQLTDDQFLAGELFAIATYDDAHRAITRIVSQGEGSAESPLDFEHELAHYYRFAELHQDQVLTRSDQPPGFAWGPSLGVDWTAVLPAIADPATHDFSGDPKAQAAQDACDAAFTRMMTALQGAAVGTTGGLGLAVRAMFDLRTAARVALSTPLAGSDRVAGPAFRYRPELLTGRTP